MILGLITNWNTQLNDYEGLMVSDVSNFDLSWEKIYTQGKMINRYPYNLVVSSTFRYFGSVAERKQIRVLDLGCGSGNHSWFFAREGFSVTGIDASPTAIQYVKDRFLDENLKGEFLLMSIEELSSLEGSFDLILDRQVLYTLDFAGAKRALEQVRRLLADGGLHFSFFYNKEHPGFSECGNSPDGHTYYDVPSRWFGETHRATLLDETSFNELFSGFEIVEHYNHRIEALTGGEEGGTSEYVTIARRAADVS